MPATSILTENKSIGSRVQKFSVENLRKARLVILGWGQLPGVYYGNTFTPVCRLNSVYIMIVATAVNDDLHLDCNRAFLTNVVGEVYVYMVPGFESYDTTNRAGTTHEYLPLLQESGQGARMTNTCIGQLQRYGVGPLCPRLWKRRHHNHCDCLPGYPFIRFDYLVKYEVEGMSTLQTAFDMILP